MSALLEKLASGACLVYQENRGVISLKGSDARAFLQRMSTNDITKLSETHPLQTSFTNSKGRMIDHCIVFAQEGDQVLLVSSHRDAGVIMGWLEQYHFIEDVVMHDRSLDFTFSYVITRRQEDGATRFGPLSTLCLVAKIASVDVTIFGILNRATIGEHISEESWQTLRIMALFPDSPHEINDSVMPQNINLSEFISDQKGCYIGQEVIAKAMTYQKNVKHLCGAQLQANHFEVLKPGSRLHNVQGQIGEITSIAPIFVAGAINALVVSDLSVKPKASDGGSLVQCLEPFISKNADKS